MKTLQSLAGKTYVVTSPNGCTVTDETGLTLGTVEAGQQKVFVATGAKLQADDDSARITATFKLAPAKLRLLGLLGGGEAAAPDALPAGYLAAEFLESSGTQRIALPDLEVLQSDSVKMRVKHVADTGYHTCAYFSSIKNPGNFRVCLYHGNANMTRFIVSFLSPEMYIYPGSKSGDFETKINEIIWDGVTYELKPPSIEAVTGLYIFTQYITNTYFNASIQAFAFEVPGKCKLLPALTSEGLPCMYDKVTNQPFYNSGTGQFVVGMTSKQALQLSTLPATGGSLTVSLPIGYEADAGLMTALETARSNGWTLTIQTYTPEDAASSASTYGMRRIWVRRQQDENGMYIDAAGNRWHVDWCVDMLTPDGSTPDEHGYELFRSVEAAVAYWELEPYVDPEAENLLLNQGE